MKKTLINLTATLVVMFALGVSCKKVDTEEVEQKEPTKEGEEQTSLSDDKEYVTVAVSLSEKKSMGLTSFSLASATSFSMALEGCVSGLAYADISNTNPNIDVYKFDQGCLVKLNNFVFNGITWVPSGGDPFSSWVAGDSAVFEDQGDPANTMKVVVSSQLDDPVSGTENVAYLFSEIVAGADQQFAQNAVGDSHALSVGGQPAPAYGVSAMSFVGLTAAGAGQFQFTLECNSAVTGSGASLACEDTLLDDLRYKLVPDTYGGVLDIDQASALFPDLEKSIDAGDKLELGQGGTANGGFITASGVDVLTGPDVMHSNPNMILIIEASDASYLYFNVDVSVLTYTP